MPTQDEMMVAQARGVAIRASYDRVRGCIRDAIAEGIRTVHPTWDPGMDELVDRLSASHLLRMKEAVTIDDCARVLGTPRGQNEREPARS